jgi:formylglycine-generating enzyme required for sulfatase activity
VKLRPHVLGALVAALLAPAAAPAADCPAGMKRIRGGAFRTAAGEGVHVHVRPFCLDTTEVTVAAYARCVEAGACHGEDLECGSAATWRRQGADRHPVNCVTWFEADAFCRAHGKRLPTESEWEWAARGGPRARTYPWGEAPPADRACWDGEGNSAGKGERRSPCPVATHPRSTSADGLHDLGGNVREWTATEVERFRVLRGGSWGDSLPEFLSAAFRGWNAPDERMELVGFRCAATLGAKARAPRRAPEVKKAALRDDGVLVMPFEVDPSR